MGDTVGAPRDLPVAKRSPLIRVLAQVRWPSLSGFDVKAVADALANQIGRDYPLRGLAQEFGLLVTPEGMTQQQPTGMLHRFSDGSGKWTITLAATFVSLETSAYTSHDEFIPRLVAVVREVKGHLPLQRWDRIGYRYTNRFSDEPDLASLRKLFSPAVLGTLALDPADSIVHTVADTLYGGAEASLLVRSAYLPPNASIDSGIPSVPGRAWLLDLDAFASGPSSDFDDSAISKQANLLARKAHDFFQKVTTDEYRARFAS